MKTKTKLIVEFCTEHKTTLEDLIQSPKTNLRTALKKKLTTLLVDNGTPFNEVAEVLQTRTQMAKYYYYSPTISLYPTKMALLEAQLNEYKAKVTELTEWLSINTQSKEYATICSDRNHFQNKVVEAKKKIHNLRNNDPILGYPDPETQWNATKNGNSI